MAGRIASSCWSIAASGAIRPGDSPRACLLEDVVPSPHVEYKHRHIKQYWKEGRALRTETAFNDTHDFGVTRGLKNFAHLRMLGQRINRRLLELERTAHDCGLSHAQLTALTAPSRTPDGQPAPALKLGDPCTTALLAALCLFVLTPAGVTNRRWWLGSWVSPTSSTPRPRWATISDESAARA